LIYITKVISRGRIQPPDADAAEYWTYKPNSTNPPWFVRAAQGKLWKTGSFENIETRSVGQGTIASEKELVESCATRVESRRSREVTM
jgi:AGZA family xanthine/uracil permease-like MFS transporter